MRVRLGLLGTTLLLLVATAAGAQQPVSPRLGAPGKEGARVENEDQAPQKEPELLKQQIEGERQTLILMEQLKKVGQATAPVEKKDPQRNILCPPVSPYLPAGPALVNPKAGNIGQAEFQEKDFPPIPRKFDPEGPKKEFPPVPRKLPDSDPKAQKLPSANPGPEGAAIIGLARIAVREGDLGEAVRRFDEYLRRYPDDLAVRLEFAGVLLRAGERTRSLDEYRRLLAARPGHTEVRLGLASLYIQAQQYHEAIPLLRAALEKAPGDLNLAARLARAYALNRDFLHALEVHDHYLGALRPGHPRVPRDLTALLLDLQRPAEAIAFLLPQRDKARNDAQILAELVRAHAQMGDYPAALRIVEEMGGPGKDAIIDRLDLGKNLVSSGDDLVATAVFSQVLAAESGNLTAQLGLAQVHIHQHLPTEALGFLCTIKPTPTLYRQWTLVWAEYHQLVGEYIAARQRYQELLVKDPLDVEARLGLAKLLQYIQEYEKAKAQYGAVPPIGGRGRQARLGIAATLYDQRRFDEAAAWCEKLLAEDPADGEAMARLMRSLIKMGACDKAIGLGQGFLARFTNLNPVAIPTQLALGRALLECGRYAEAAREHECLLGRPGGRFADVWYGLFQSHAKMKDMVKADMALVEAFRDPGHETRNRLLIADLFYGDYDDRRADDLARTVLHHEPKNLAALVRLADAQLREARPSGNIDPVVETTKNILTLSPTNVRGQLALARAYSVAQDFKSAVAQYDRLLAVDATFLVPLIEKARALFSGHQFEASAITYAQAQRPGPEEFLRDGLAFFLQTHPAFRQELWPCLDVVTGGHALEGELKKLAGTLADPTARVVVQALLLGAEARAAEVIAIKLEADAKSARDWRNFAAKSLYEKLVAVQPNSVEGYFDLGQVDGQLRQTQNALAAFGQVLQIDPLHREAAMASERASLALSPSVSELGNVYNQSGRQGLANDTRMRVGALVNLPIGMEDEAIGFGASGLYYLLPGYHPLSGEMLTINASKRLDEHVLVYALTNVEVYQSRISIRPTYEIGGRFTCYDGTTVTANTFLNNVIENGESVQQDIYRFGGNLGFESQLSRFWQIGANYRFAHYSDVNTMSEIYAHTDFLASLPPEQLKFVARLDYLKYSEGTTFGPGESLSGAIHPYFAPNGFTFFEGRVEYTHWLSRDYFVYSNQAYFSLQYGLGFDSNAAVYNSFRVLLNCDIKSWLSAGIDAEAQITQAYNMQQVSAYLTVRWPRRP